jgi:hypothetical protein
MPKFNDKELPEYYKKAGGGKPKMPEMREYKCTECANKGTPVCEVCRSIVNGGKVYKKPTHYTAYAPIDMFAAPPSLPYNMEQDGVAYLLMQTLKHRMPLPISVVMDYNKHAEYNVEQRRLEKQEKE